MKITPNLRETVTETFYGDWERVARECVAILRSAAGRDSHDRDPARQMLVLMRVFDCPMTMRMGMAAEQLS